jgi:hypothetical protein
MPADSVAATKFDEFVKPVASFRRAVLPRCAAAKARAGGVGGVREGWQEAGAAAVAVARRTP